MKRVLVIVGVAIGGIGLFLGAALLGDAVTDGPPRQGPTELNAVAEESTVITDVPIFAPTFVSDDPIGGPNAPEAHDPPPAIGSASAAVPADEAGGVEPREQGEPPPPDLERVFPEFVFDDPDPLLDSLDEGSPPPEGAVVTVHDVVGPIIDLDRLREAFTAACVADPTGCPVGVPAAVLGSLESGDVPLELHVAIPTDATALRCDFGEPGPFDLPLLITTTNFAAITITYSLPPDDFGQVQTSSLGASGPGGPEFDLWRQRVDAEEVGGSWPDGWVQQCVVLPALLEGQLLYTVEVTAMAANGSVATETYAFEPPTFADRALPGVRFSGDNRMRMNVPLNEGEWAHLWPIDVAEYPDTDCSDIEAAAVTGRRNPDKEHPDFQIRGALWNAAPPVVDERGDRSYVADLPYREGRRYVVCVWIYTVGERSFDTIEVVERYRYEVYTPNRYRVYVTLLEANIASVATPGTHMSLSLPGCPEMDPTAYVQVDGPASLQLGVRLCDSGGGEMPDRLTLAGSFVNDTGEAHGRFGTIPIDATVGCDTGRHDAGCAARSRMEIFDLFLPITPQCPGCEVDGTVRVRVDYAASNGEGAGNWIVGLEGTFPPPLDEIPATDPPSLDTYGLRFYPVYDGVGDRLRVEFETNRPTRAEITVEPADPSLGCPTVVETSFDFATNHTLYATGLCPDTGHYLHVSLTDEEGQTADFSGANRWFSHTRPYRLGDLEVYVTLLEVDTAGAAARCAEISEAILRFEGDALPDECWTSLSYAGLDPTSARWYLQGGTTSATRWPSCVTGDPAVLTGLTEYIHGRFLSIGVSIPLHLTAECGAVTPLSGGDPARRLESEGTVEKSLATYGWIQGILPPVSVDELLEGERVILGQRELGGLTFLIEATLSPVPEFRE